MSNNWRAGLRSTAMSEVYISYASADREVAEAIADRLSSEGFSLFSDEQTLVPGKSLSEVMVKQLQRADAVVALLSSRSQRTRSVEEELQAALKRKKLVVPVLLDSGAKDNWL